VSDSQVLGDLLDQIPLMSKLIQSIQMGLMTQSNAVRSLQIGKHAVIPPRKMRSLGKIQRPVR
jgi:hypothetical protein